MANRAKRHAHKYHHLSVPFGKIWACALPDCSHYMPQHMESMLVGKHSICWNCGEVFTLDDRNMKDNQPQCYDCNPSPFASVIKEIIPESEPKTIEEVIADLSKGK